jgi:hypothetical protein
MFLHCPHIVVSAPVFGQHLATKATFSNPTIAAPGIPLASFHQALRTTMPVIACRRQATPVLHTSIWLNLACISSNRFCF